MIGLREPARRPGTGDRAAAPRSTTKQSAGGPAIAVVPGDTNAIGWLQRTAGNQAVVQLLGGPVPRSAPTVQQQPVNPPVADPTVAERLAAAKKATADGKFDARILEVYKDGGGSATRLADQLWLDELADVDPNPPDKRQRAAAAAIELAFKQRAETVLVKLYRDLVAELRTPAGTTRLRTDVTDTAGTGKGWADRDVMDVLWSRWVGPGRIRDLTGGPNYAAAEFWRQLQAGAGRELTTLRGTEFAPSAVAAFDAAEVEAVRAAIEPRSSWVEGEVDLAALADTTMAALGKPVNRTTTEWKALNRRMRKLLIAAEVLIINKQIPQYTKVTPERWAELRGRWLVTITKPIWRFHADNIVAGSIFGYPVHPKEPGSGMHRDVLRAIRLVEESALRLSGATKMSELTSAEGTRGVFMRGGKARPITIPGSEFRFEPMSHPDWMRKASHLSYHGTGRAVDFRAETNPAIEGPVHQLISILGGAELSEQNISGADLAAQAGRMAPAMHKRAELEERLKTEQDPAVRTQIQSDIARLTTGLADLPQGAAGTALREQVRLAHERIINVEGAFQVTWFILRLMNWNEASLVEALLARVEQAKTDAETALAKVAADKTLWREAAVLKERLRRVEEVRGVLGQSTAGGVTLAQKALIKAGDTAVKSGLTDLPLWLVQAFIEQGWAWGGVWPGFSDAMHFDYRAPVADVFGQ
jgi:hypothetical protein